MQNTGHRPKITVSDNGSGDRVPCGGGNLADRVPPPESARIKNGITLGWGAPKFTLEQYEALAELLQSFEEAA